MGHNQCVWAEEGIVGNRQGPQPGLDVHHSLYVVGSTESSQTTLGGTEISFFFQTGSFDCPGPGKVLQWKWLLK